MPDAAARGTRPHGVLVTRPEPGAAETAARLKAMGWRPVLGPALVLSPRPFARPPRAQALLLPSRAAARALAPWPIPVLAVGPGTAEAARAQGFIDTRAAEGDAAALVALCRATLDPAAGPLLLAVGEGYSLELAARLRKAGFAVIRRVVYAAQEATTLPAPALLALQADELSHALFFSPRSAKCSLSVLNAAGLRDALRRIDAIAISPRVAIALAAMPWRRIRVAARPDHEHILELLGAP